MRKIGREPKILGYRSVTTLYELRDWFYNTNEVDNRIRAVEKVHALTSRGRLPHAVESTSHFTSIILKDRETGDSCDSDILRLSYTMALVRFVNGLLDPYQQSSFAIPLHQLAKNLNLPNYFVELRHMGTHESIPSIDILRRAARNALIWLNENFWSHLEQYDELDMKNSPDDAHSKLVEFDKYYTDISGDIKTFKRIRKRDLDTIIKFGNSTSVGQKYWKSMHSLKSKYKINPEFFITVLIYKNCLIYNEDKLRTKQLKNFKFNNLLIKLYRPLIDELGGEFKFELMSALCKELEDFAENSTIELKSEMEFSIVLQEEYEQLFRWLEFLIKEVLIDTLLSEKGYKGVLPVVETVLEIISRIPPINRLELISLIESTLRAHTNNSKAFFSILEATDPIIKQAKLNSFSSTMKPSQRSLDNSNEDRAAITAHERVDKADSTVVCFFESHKQWNPLPFGVSSIDEAYTSISC